METSTRLAEAFATAGPSTWGASPPHTFMQGLPRKLQGVSSLLPSPSPYSALTLIISESERTQGFPTTLESFQPHF